MHLRPPVQTLLAAIAGLLIMVIVWLVIVPWDLSTHANGRPIAGAPTGDQLAVRMLIALAIPFVAAIAIAFTGRPRPAFALWASASIAWTILSTWRGMAAEVSGANMAVLWAPIGLFASVVGMAIVLVTGSVVERFRSRRPNPSVA
jgi:hypothetical protein